MTVKQLVKRLNQEKYDILKAKVKIYLDSGDVMDVASVSLNKDTNEVILRASDDDVKIMEN